ncbi:MAG: cyclase dehydrase [Acetobacteraceae bacterium]
MANPRTRPAAVVSTSTDSLSRGLGWFSIGLGLAELLAPRMISRSLGIRGRENTIAAFGMREIATGVSILTAQRRGPLLWGRVGGDALDIASLAGALHRRNPHKGTVFLALATVAGVTALDLFCARSLDAEENQVTPGNTRDYSDRSGFKRSPEQMRGAARDAVISSDMRTPEAMKYHSA